MTALLTAGDSTYRPGGVSRDRSVLLLADQSWNAQGGGAVILRDLLGDALGNGVVWATPSQAESDSSRGQYGLAAGSAGRGRFSLAADMLWNAGRLAAEVRELAARVNASGIWIVLHGASVAIAAHLIRDSSLPIHATVHDDPLYATAIRSRRIALFVPLLAKQFARVMRAAKSVDVVCQKMADRYKRKYGVDCAILHRGLSAAVPPSPTYSLARDGLQVGVLGNTYSAKKQLLVLGQAVEKAAARLAVRPSLVVCGGGSTPAWLKQELAGRVEVEVLGHVSEEAGIERLRHCAALYINYPFGWINRVLRETSFPTKLSTYIYAARPILVHAPPGTSLSDISVGSQYLIDWPTMKPEDGAARLTEFFSNPRSAESYHIPAELVRHTYYDLSTHRATLDRLLRNLVASTSH